MKLFTIFTGLLLAASPAWGQSTTPADPFGNFSIFSRFRGGAATTETRPGTPPAAIRTPAPLFVGTLQEDAHMTAVLEVATPKGSAVVHLKEGEIVEWDQSRVVRISQGSIELSSAAAPRIVALGNDLLNQPITGNGTPLTRSLPQPRQPAPFVRTRRTPPPGTSPALR
jgi:hypothetical protein